MAKFEMSKSRQGIIYVYPKRFAFVAKDIELLSSGFDVREHRFDRGGKWMLPWCFAVQFLWLLKARISGIREVLVHFAGYHALLPVFLGFRTHIIVAGSDACSFPKINYGNFRKPFLSKCIGYAMRGAKTILPVHASLATFQNTYSDLGPEDQGFVRFVPDLHTPVHAVPYGFDAARWDPGDVLATKREGVLCVAAGARYNDPVYFRKGLDLVYEAAKKLKDVHFTIVGAETVRDYPPLPNIRILGRVSADELKGLLASCSIYCQVSVMEGFPNALCEAMLMGCIPIVSNVTSMPDIVEDLGKVLPKRDDQLLRDSIAALLALPEQQRISLREQVRQRIASRYPAELRLKELAGLID